MAKPLTPKIKVLEFIEENEIVTSHDLISEFGMAYKSAVNRCYYLKRAGLVEPLVIDRGKWVLSITGYRKLEYLRSQKNVQ